MRNKIVLIGGGGHCKVAISLIQTSTNFEIYGITDSKLKIGSSVNGIKVLGTDKILKQLHKKGITNALISVGSIKDNTLREKLYIQTKNIGFSMPAIVSKFAIVDKTAKIGYGTVVLPGTIINANARIGQNCIINTGSIIEHDVKIDNHCHVAPGAVICGSCNIMSKSFIGSGATVINNINIGQSCVVGAGSVVIRNIESKSIVTGIPAKRVK